MLHVPQTGKLLHFRGKYSPNNSNLKIDTGALLSITEPQHGHVVWNFWHSLYRGQRESRTVSCYSFTEQMLCRKRANGEIFSLHLSDGSIVIKPAHLFNLSAAGGILEIAYYLTAPHVLLRCIRHVCGLCVCKKKKKMKSRDGRSIHHFSVIPEKKSTGPNDSIVKQ